MGKKALMYFEKLEGSSIESNKSGQIPQREKYRKHFVDIETGLVSEVTDLQIRKGKRNRIIDNFNLYYYRAFTKKKISILSFVVREDSYNSISQFLNSISKKFIRKNVDKLGYVWVRDVGDEKFEKHFHLLLATDRICPKLFKEFFGKKKHTKYDVEFLNNPKGFKAYLIAKNLYGGNKKRAFGRSREFKRAY